jgi:CubicO group peptidase (beta-lactamase class C family)
MRGYGLADLEFDVPTPDAAIYETGSVTKQFTAAAILQLQEQGKLRLDDELTKYLSDYPTQGHRITIRRLMDHTSGIRGYTELPGFGTIMTRRLPKDSLVALFKDEKFDFAPGEGMVYNNSAYFLLGLIIEKVSGTSYAEYVDKNLFDRAGMPDSRYCDERAVIKRRANGYDMSPNGLLRAGYIDHTYPYSAGSLCSTVGDLVAWTQALHGGRVLSAESYRELITPDTLNDGTRLRYAKGLSVNDISGHRAIHHGGGINGFLSELAYFPDDSLIIAVLINTAGPTQPAAIRTNITELILGKREARAQRFAGDRRALVGDYEGVGRGGRLRLKIGTSGDTLTAQVGNGRPMPLIYVGNDTFASGSSRFTFVREQGRVAKVRADLVAVYSVLSRRSD